MGAVLQPCSSNKTEVTELDLEREYNETITNFEASKKEYRRARRDSTTIQAFVRRKPSVVKDESSDISSMASSEKFDVTPYYSDRPEMEARKEMGEVVMQQVMLRVKDPKRSLDFYTKVLGMTLLIHRDFPQFNFTVYFLAYVKDPSAVPTSGEEQWLFACRTPGCIELTWNYGTESEGPDRIYNTGNSDATGVSAEPSSEGAVMKSRGGFGHLGITVPDVYKECERLHKLGVEMFKSPNGGGIRGIAFIRDPDGYAIEILTHQPIGPQLREVDCLGNKAKEGQGVV